MYRNVTASEVTLEGQKAAVTIQRRIRFWRFSLIAIEIVKNKYFDLVKPKIF